MMVTFVSQCEKNALKKTRKVLDAFADRIGDNTWQTAITEDGLNTVKKMLRQTASRSTAVSCHWIRSRSRIQFLWVVGNKDKFDEQGKVPVNYTSNELIMDEKKKMSEIYYANTQKQPLDKHLFAVGYVAYQLIKRLINDEKLAMAVFVAGCLHDLGKLDPAFQSWIVTMLNKKSDHSELPDDGLHIDKGNFSFDKHARHNEISLLLYYFFDDENGKEINKSNKKMIQHVIYWHHAKPVRKEEFTSLKCIYRKLIKSLDKTKLEDFFVIARHLLKSVNAISNKYDEQNNLQISGLSKRLDDDKLNDLSDNKLPEYKKYLPGCEDVREFISSINQNAKNNLARSAVITADRLVSSLTADQLDAHINNRSLNSLLTDAIVSVSSLSSEIYQCLQKFEQSNPSSHRNKQQSEAAKQLSNVQGIAVLNGPAGCGKTKIALEWAANSQATKIIWICPRVQVCQGLFLDLTSDDYLPNSKIEICTGEFKFIWQKRNKTVTPEGNEFSGDIVLTTIDQILNTILTHRNVTSLIDFLNAHVVFDEYHEYIQMPAFNLLFAEFVQCKRLQHQPRALLVSATPNYYFLKSLLEIDREEVIGIESFNTDFHRSFKSTNLPLTKIEHSLIA